jgi:parallel beta-helix repeat protein
VNLNIWVSVFIFFCIFTTGAFASNYIYQENGDSYYCDGNVVSPLYFNDSNWGTYANAVMGATGNCYVNYTKPEFASSNSIWQEKDQPTTNVTVISSCYSQTPLQFRSQMYWDNINPSLSYVKWDCWNGAGWSNLDTNGSTYTAYEEAMFWNTSINSCTNLTMAGTYTLDSDLTGHQAGWNRCLSVHTDNVILDCQGHKIENYTTSGDFVIALGGYENITIKNCIMNNYTYGIYMGNTDYSTIYNNSISNMYGYGLSVVSNADNNNISYNNITNVTTTDGIRINSNSDNNYIGHNIVNNTPSEFGIALWTNCSNNTVEYNTVDGANVGILTQLGSWYNNISHNTIYDNTQRGMMFLDNASYNTVYNNTFYGAFTQACLLTQRNNTGNVYDSNNLITCGTYGFWDLASGGYSTNMTYKNNYVYNSTSYGIYIQNGNIRNIYNNTIAGSGNYGMYIENTNNSNITENEIYNATTGLRIYYTSINNTVNDNYFHDISGAGFSIDNFATPSFTTVSGNRAYRTGLGLAFWNNPNSTINNNDVQNTSSSTTGVFGIDVAVGSNYVDVYDNYVYNTSVIGNYEVHGIRVHSSLNSNVYNNTVNLIKSTTTASSTINSISFVTNCDNSNIYNNTIDGLSREDATGTSVGISVVSTSSSSNCNIYNNTIGYNGESLGRGFILFDTKGVVIHDNYVNTSAFGVVAYLITNTGNKIYNNEFIGHRNNSDSSGIVSTYMTAPIDIYDNILTGYIYGIRIGLTSAGFYPSNLTNSTNNIMHDNDYGIFINSGSMENNFTDDSFYNNSISDVKVISGYNNRFRNVTIGYDDNKVKSSFDGTNYTIKQVLSSQRPLDPTGYRNVSDYLNMTNTTANGWLFINMTYNQSIVDSYSVFSENSLRLWRNSSGTWTNVGDGVDTTNNYVYANVSGSEFGSIFAPMGSNSIDQCNATINDAGTYILDNSINATTGLTSFGSCIDINSSDVILDCNGYEIIGDGTDTTYGVRSSQHSNIAIKNCTIYNFTNAIDFNGVNSSLIENNTLYLNNIDGISMNTGQNNTINDNRVYDNKKIGIYYNSSYNANITNNVVYNNSWSCSPAPSVSCCGIGGSSNATIINNEIYGNNNGDGITIYGDYNVIRNNTMYNNSDAIYVFWLSDYNLIDLNNIYNNSGGIYFSSSTRFNNITSNTVSNNGAWGIFSSGSATLSQRNTNFLIWNNTVSNHTNQDIYVYGNNDTIVDDNTLYDSSTSLIIQDSSRINATNNDIYDGSIGISMTSYLNDSLVEFNNIYRGVQGIYTTQATNNIIRNNNVYDFSNQGIHLSGSSTNNIITLNNVSSATSNYAGIHVNGSCNYNTVSFNNIFASNNFGIEITSNDHNNVSNNYVVNTTNNAINTDSCDDTLVENNYVEIKSPNMLGMSFVGTTPQYNRAINNTIIGQSSNQIGILAHRCDGCLADANDVSNLSLGIAFDVESKDSNITNNNVHDGTGMGIQAYSYGYAPVTNIFIYGNNVTNVGNAGIHVNTANNSRIENNIVMNESIGNDNHAILLTNSNDTVIYNNHIENYGFGIDVRGTSDPYQTVSFNNTVENNYISPNIDNIALGQYGVGVCCGASGTRVINNTALNTDYGINVWWFNVDDTLVENNTLYDVTTQMSIRGDVSPSQSDLLSGVIVRNNRFYDTRSAIRTFGVNGLYITNISDMLIENNIWTNLSTYHPAFAYFDQPVIFGTGSDRFNNITFRYNNITHSSLGIAIQTGEMNNTKIHDNYFETDIYGIGVVFSCGSGNCINNSVYNNIFTGNTETFLSSGYVSTGDNSPIEVYNNTMYNNQWGIRLGLTAFAYQPTTNTIFHNNTIYNNTIGVYINSGSYNNTFSYDWIFNNTNWDVQVLHGTNTLNYVKLGSNANEMTIDSIIASNVSFKDVKIAERYSDPPSYRNISRYINATNNSISNYLTLNMSYEDADWISAGIYNDTFLGMWKNSGTGWTRLPSSVDTTNNYVYANLSNNFSQMTILGDTIIDVDGDGYLNTVDCDDFNYTIRPVDNNTFYSLNTNLTICYGNYYNVSFTINSNDINLDCNNSLIESDPTQDFIDIYSSNNTQVLNCNNFGAGMSIRMSDANNSLIRNNTLFTNTFGINMEDSYDNDMENNTIYDSLTAVRSTVSSNNLFTYTLIGYAGIEVLTTEFEGYDYTIIEVPVIFRPLLFNTSSSDYRDIGKFLEISSMSASSWIDINYKYDDADFYNSNITFEDRINMWRYDGANWNNITASTIDTVNNIVYSSNITNFSIFAPLGEEYYTCGFQNLNSNIYKFPYQFNVTVGSYEDVILEYNGQNYSYLSGNLSNDGNTFYYEVYQQDTYGITPYKWYCNNSVGIWNSTSTQHWLFDLPSFWELAVILAVLFIAGIFAYLSVKMDKEEHGHIQILLTLMSIIMLVVGIAITMMIAEQKGQTVIKDILSGGAYMPMIIIVIVVTFSLLIKFLVDIFRMYKVNPSKKTRSR